MLTKQTIDKMVGKKVKIVKCEAKVHDDNEGCLCRLIGKKVTIEHLENTMITGAPSYKIKWRNKYLCRSEISET